MGTPVDNPGTTIKMSTTTGGVATLQVTGLKTISEIVRERPAYDATCLEDTEPVMRASAMKSPLTITIGGPRYFDDAGQQQLVAAHVANAPRNFEIELNDGATSGTKYNFAAQISRIADNIQGENNQVMWEYALVVDMRTLTTAAAV